MIWRNMATNEEFHLQSDGTVYRSGPRYEGSFQNHEHPARGVLVETISSIPDFIRDIQNDSNCFVEHLHTRFLSRRTRKVAPVGRKVIWVRWIDNGETYELKSDYTIRDASGHTVAGRLPLATDVSTFIASLRREGHEIVYIHPRFQKPRDVVRRRGKPTPSLTEENGATANVRPVKAV